MCAPEASALRSWHAALCRRHDRYHLRPHDENRAVLAVCKLKGIIGDLIEGAFNTLIGQSGWVLLQQGGHTPLPIRSGSSEGEGGKRCGVCDVGANRPAGMARHGWAVNADGA